MSSWLSRHSEPVRLRSAALGELWRQRASWRQPLPRALMRLERGRLRLAFVPAGLLIAGAAGLLLFAALPRALADAYPAALSLLWPLWVVHVAPVAAALLLSLQRAPTLALELLQRQQRGEFAALALLGSCPSVYPCLPLLVAHAAVAAAAASLMIAGSLLAGAIVALAGGVGDIRSLLDAVFSLVSPIDWLRGLGSAAVFGGLGSLAVMLYAWPGTQSARAAVDVHRLGARAMHVAALASLVAAALLNGGPGLLTAGRA